MLCGDARFLEAPEVGLMGDVLEVVDVLSHDVAPHSLVDGCVVVIVLGLDKLPEVCGQPFYDRVTLISLLYHMLI